MSIRHFFKSALLISFFLATSSQALAAEHGISSKVEKPNVLFIIVDDLNDYLGTFGGHPQSKTPNIDALAAQSVQFTNAQTNAPVCQSSRNSLFTGVYPHKSKDFGWTPLTKQHVLKHNKTFLQLFKENGYQMLGTGKLLHKNQIKLWHEWGVPERINYGPHAFNGKKIVGHPSVPEPFRSINIVDGSFAPLTDVPKFNLSKTDKVKHAAGWGYPHMPFNYVDENNRDRLPDEQHAIWASNKLKELAKANSKQPFFMGIGFVRPHTPLYAPKRFFDMFPLESIKLPTIKENDLNDSFFKDNYPMTQMGLSYFKALQESYEDDEEGLKKVIQAYLACIAFMDEQLGIVIDALNNSSLKDNTIVVFTSDHGWQFGEKDYLYKNSPWEESAKVPMLWKVPGKSVAGLKQQQPISLVDLYPSFIDLANLKGSTSMSKGSAPLGGFSIAPLLKTDTSKQWQGPKGALTVMGVGIDTPIEGLAVGTNRQALWHVKVIKDLPDEYIWQQTYSYRTKDWRYIRYKDGQEELYDHRNDPFEWHNLAQDKKYSQQKKILENQMTNIINHE
ncbi:sulfatase [Thalassotalea nanhaiensis]|uniref:Sulfatase n=1 Tax=Thalassotalea nanhaiensis TaxID=3065648 RepID=A0ABY9TL82_9GAMM|nr:sulfatase [Colwelliaceae bacterium SQ345]